MNSHQKMGFRYLVEVVRDGIVVDSEVVDNLMPLEALNHVLGVTLKGTAQNASWYIGIFEGNFTPVGSEQAATIAAASTECTTYAETTRVPFTSGAVSGGSVDNSASKAEFTMNANKTIYGGFLVSTAAKAATSGVVLSAVRFSSPKVLESGAILRVTAGVVFASS